MARLIILRDARVQMEVELTAPTMKIGRDPQNEIVLEDATKGVSRIHAEIRLGADGYTITDLNSRNGTWVNGRRVAESTLTAATVVTVGPYELRFDSATEPAPATTAEGAYTVFDPPAPEPLPEPILEQAAPVRTPRDRTSRRRRQFLFFAAVVLLILTAMFGVWLYQGRAATEPPPTTADRPEELVRPTREQQIDQHLADARRRLDENDAEAALNEIERVLDLDPVHAVALGMKEEAHSRRLPVAPPTEPPPREPPSTLQTQTEPGISRKPGEPPLEYARRVQRIKSRYQLAGAASGRGDTADEIAQLTALLADQPEGYRDATEERVTTLKRRLLEERFLDATRAAAAAEQKGELAAALEGYRTAGRAMATPEIQSKIEEIAGRMRTELDGHLSRARVRYSLNQTPQAIQACERAMALLPDPDASGRCQGAATDPDTFVRFLEEVKRRVTEFIGR